MKRRAIDATVSITARRDRVFRYFLSALIAISVGSVCIENGLHPLLLAALPAMIIAVLRRDYTRPFLWSERKTLLLFVLYVLLFTVAVTLMQGRVTLPSFMVYFAFGTLFVRTLLPLTDRNLWQTIALTMGLILINCILTNHLIFGLVLPGYFFVLMGTLLLFHNARHNTWSGESSELPVGKKFTATWYGKLTVYTLVVLAFTVVTFVLVPRPFLVIPGLRTGMAHAGGLAQLEQRITYRDMTGMAGRNRIAFKVRMEQGELPPNPYWRGRVLDRFDGQSWSESGRMRGMGRIIRALPWETLDYRFIPYRLQSKIVYVNGLPVSATGRLDRPLYISNAGEVVVDSPFLFSDSYRISSVDRPVPASYRPEPFTTDTTGISPRIENLAKDWSARLATARDKAGAIVSRLRSGYRYRLQAPAPPEGVNPIEYFLFESRTGNCEHFAGALGLLLRAAGIPARVVEGFAGAEKTDVPDEFVVRFARAHAWVEALLEPAYWTTLDATPAVGSDLGENRVWRFLVDSYDDLEHLWIKQVVYFDRADQATIFRALRRLLSGEITIPRWIASFLGSHVKASLAGAGLLVMVVAVLMYALRRKKSDFPTMYLTTMKELEKKGLLSSVHPWHEMNSAQIVERCPAAGDALATFMHTYLKRRFRGTPQDPSYEDLEKARQDLLHSVKTAGYL